MKAGLVAKFAMTAVIITERGGPLCVKKAKPDLFRTAVNAGILVFVETTPLAASVIGMLTGVPVPPPARRGTIVKVPVIALEVVFANE